MVEILAVRQPFDRLDVGPSLIEPGSPRENGYCETFGGRLRDERLNREIFYTLEEVKSPIEAGVVSTTRSGYTAAMSTEVQRLRRWS